MDKINSSDINPTMSATRTFDDIIDHIQNSNLNFHLQMSPFSAVISLKRSLIKDKFGSFLLPSIVTPKSSKNEIAALASKNLMLENKVIALQKDLESAVDDCAAAHGTIRFLQTETKLKTESIDYSDREAHFKEIATKKELINILEFDNDQLRKDNDHLQISVANLNDGIHALEVSNKKQKEIADKLHKNINETKVKSMKEKEQVEKEHRAEVKSWRKDLGEEVKEKVKLEKTLKKLLDKVGDEPPTELIDTPADSITTHNPHAASPPDSSSLSSSTFCSICAIPILNYVPKYFLSEKFNPACETCDDDPGEFDVDVSSKEIDDIALNQKSTESVEQQFTPRGFNSRPTLAAQAFLSSNNCAHTKQCIIRQPFPPPIPALTPLVNMYSLYHMKTLAGELDWGSTCAYCMRIDYEKYGCESCVWIKCFGDLHGYPDVDPYDFKKYL